MKKVFLIAALVLSQVAFVVGQTCVFCDQTPLGTGASIIGNVSTADGQGSIAIGTNAHALSNATSSIAIGTMVKTIAGKSIVIGCGSGVNAMLTNTFQESLMIGFNSSKPTMFVSRSPYEGTGTVGIGNVVDEFGILKPLAKLHLRADEGEDAAIFIQPYNWLEGDAAGLALGDMSHGMSASKSKGLTFSTSSYYNFNEGYLKIGKDARTGYVLVCADDDGTARWAPVELPDPSPWTSLETGDIYFNGGNSKVGIGTINNTSFALAVQGSIITDEVMVRVQEEWYDFVLKPDYKLMPLNQLSEFISQHHHLPDVPSENEVKENGFGLAEMNGILLKKVEELTLYILEQQKVLETQREELNMIKEKLGN
ncbi:MAG: hypothetical protein KKF98_07975 [Bacteroidetes bacterium]|nr:hypothetical protein [Bacteroidota bacterium]